MAKIKIYLDPVANSMNIWWAEPSEAYSSEESKSPDNNDVIIKNKKGIPVSLEIIGVFPDELNIVKLIQKYYPALKTDEPFLLETSDKGL